MTPEQAIDIAKETCGGLEFAHSRGIVHRDLKPGNVWLTGDGVAKMAEIEFSVLARRVLRRRIADEDSLSGEIAALEGERNQTGATIDWRFSIEDARVKLHHLYPVNN